MENQKNVINVIRRERGDVVCPQSYEEPKNLAGVILERYLQYHSRTVEEHEQYGEFPDCMSGEYLFHWWEGGEHFQEVPTVGVETLPRLPDMGNTRVELTQLNRIIG